MNLKYLLISNRIFIIICFNTLTSESQLIPWNIRDVLRSQNSRFSPTVGGYPLNGQNPLKRFWQLPLDTWVSAIEDRDQTNYGTAETVMKLHLHDVRCFVGSFRRTISFLWIIFLPTKLHFHVGGGEAIVEEVWRMRNDWVSGVPSSHEDLHQTPSPAPPSSSSPRY